MRKSESIRQMWIPKVLNLKNAHPLILIKILKSMQWRSYVASKDLLESQGYYQGNSKLWLPKQTRSLRNPKPSHSLQAYPSKPIKTWKPDTYTSSKGLSYPYGRLHTIKIWIPKRLSVTMRTRLKSSPTPLIRPTKRESKTWRMVLANLLP